MAVVDGDEDCEWREGRQRHPAPVQWMSGSLVNFRDLPAANQRRLTRPSWNQASAGSTSSIWHALSAIVPRERGQQSARRNTQRGFERLADRPESGKAQRSNIGRQLYRKVKSCAILADCEDGASVGGPWQHGLWSHCQTSAPGACGVRVQ